MARNCHNHGLQILHSQCLRPHLGDDNATLPQPEFQSSNNAYNEPRPLSIVEFHLLSQKVLAPLVPQKVSTH
jgi:hypothetical protein